MLLVAIDGDAFYALHDAGLEAVAEGGEPGGFLGHFEHGEFAGCADADDAGDVEGAGAKALFVSAAVEEGGEADAGIFSADVEDAGARGAVELMAGHAEEVDLIILDIDGDFAD